MRKAVKTVTIFCFLFVFVAACSKEKRIENHLYKQGGVWYINSWTESGTENGIESYNYTYSNPGTFVFEKNGTGILTMDGDIMAFFWSNTKDQVTIVVDSEGIVFDIIDESRKKMELKYTRKEVDAGSTYEDIITIKLDKK